MLALRRVALALLMLAALAVGGTTFARGDMVMPCPMMDEVGGNGDVDCPMPCAAGVCVSLPIAPPNGISSAIHHSFDRAERVASAYSFAVTGRDPPPPFHPPRV